MDFLTTDQGRLLLAAAAALVVLGFVLLRATRPEARRTIRVIGVGGAGANAVDAMRRAGMRGVEYVAINTDLAALNRAKARTKIAIGRSVTRGLGTGGDVGAGQAAAREAAETIGQAVGKSDLVVVVAGLGGGTGSGAAPVIADIARGRGALTVAVVTKPFGFEGFRKARIAQEAETALVGMVDAVATIPNDQVRATVSGDVTVEDAFGAIDGTVRRNVAEIVEMFAVPGRVSLDFSDVRAVLRGGGAAAMGFGRATGEHRASEATREAMSATLLDERIRGASSVLVNVSGSRKLRLSELDAVAETILAQTGRETNLIFGVSLRPQLRDQLQVTVVATGASAPAQPATTPRAVPAASGAGDGGEPEAAQAAESVDTDPATWRPAWLRRTTPPGTVVRDIATEHAETKSASRRSRKHRARSRGGSAQPDEA
jgi:cell division protein FtsZ